MGAQIAAYVLAGIAAVEAVALVAFWRRCAGQERELDELRRRVDTRNMLFTGGREAVKQMWNTANILRKDGFEAAVRRPVFTFDGIRAELARRRASLDSATPTAQAQSPIPTCGACSTPTGKS